VERLAPYVQPIGPEPESLVSVEPLRWWLEGWIAATGDRAAIVARGFDVDADVIDVLLDGEIRVMRRSDAARLCRSFGLDTAFLRHEPGV
jgi:hypothetical protein